MQALSLRGLYVSYSVRGPNSCFKKKRKNGTILSGMSRRRSQHYCVGKKICFYLLGMQQCRVL